MSLQRCRILVSDCRWPDSHDLRLTCMQNPGFIAVAFAQKSFAVIDMRGPEVIMREGYSEDGKKVKKRKGSQNLPGESQAVAKIKWTICRVGADPKLALRLIVTYVKGYVAGFQALGTAADRLPPTDSQRYSHLARFSASGSSNPRPSHLVMRVSQTLSETSSSITTRATMWLRRLKPSSPSCARHLRNEGKVLPLTKPLPT